MAEISIPSATALTALPDIKIEKWGDVSVKDVYRDGVVELFENVDASNGQNVVVIFPDLLPAQDEESYRDRLWRKIAKVDPQFLEMTCVERQIEFERISAKVADSTPYRTPEEFVKAMRSENFDPVGHGSLCN